MEFSDVIQSRRSIRKYKTDPVPKELVEKILIETVNNAPSACNKQPWKFLVIGEGELKTQVINFCKRNQFMHDAPYVIVALADQQNCYEIIGNHMRSDVMDLSIVFEHLLLTATNYGLATCWIGAFESDKLEALLGVNYPWRVLALTPIGYADQAGIYNERKPYTDVVQWLEG